MAKVIRTFTKDLRISSVAAERMDVSVLRDFMQALDEQQVGGHVPVKGYYHEGRLVELTVHITQTHTEPPTDPASTS